MRILLDTNVILDVILARDPYVLSANKIIEMICNDEVEAAVTASSITDIYYIVKKRLGDVTARDAVRHILNIFNIINVDGADCDYALNLPISDFEDAVVVICAKRGAIDYIVTNDKEFLQVTPKLARVISVDGFLAL